MDRLKALFSCVCMQQESDPQTSLGDKPAPVNQRVYPVSIAGLILLDI
jgi:hypothetical protein